MANNVRLQPCSLPSLPSQAPPKSRLVNTTSDYDAFDYEENGLIEDGEDDENDAGDNRPVYSDFRMLSSSDSDEEFDNTSYSFDTLDTSYHLGIDHGEKAINLVLENERQDEVSVAPVKPEILPFSFSGLVAIGV